MASPGEKRGLCGHLMAGFDKHSYYARCQDKKGSDPVLKMKFILSVMYSLKIRRIDWPLQLIRKRKKSESPRQKSRVAPQWTLPLFLS